MTTDGKHEETAQEEGEDALWRLLERAPRPGPVSPYFARRVLREVAALEETHPSAAHVSNWLARLWKACRRAPGLVSASAVAAVALLAAGGIGLSSARWHAPVSSEVASRTEPETPGAPLVEEPASPVAVVDTDATGPAALAEANSSPSAATSSEPVVTAQDVEVIADLDNVLSRAESRLWTDDDTARY